MNIRLLPLAAAAVLLVGCAAEQEKAARAFPTVLTLNQQQGFLEGSWRSERFGRSRLLKVAIDANRGSPEFTGQLQFFDSPCMQWRPITGSVSADSTVTMKSDLGAPCGEVLVTGRFEGGKLSGSYRAEYPDHGKVEVQ